MEVVIATYQIENHSHFVLSACSSTVAKMYSSSRLTNTSGEEFMISESLSGESTFGDHGTTKTDGRCVGGCLSTI